jgi:hypothetical protein
MDETHEIRDRVGGAMDGARPIQPARIIDKERAVE